MPVLASLWKGVDFQDPAAVTSTCSLARRRGAPPAESISQPRPFETDAGAGQVLASDKQAGAQGSGLLHAYEPYAGTRMHPFEGDLFLSLCMFHALAGHRRVGQCSATTRLPELLALRADARRPCSPCCVPGCVLGCVPGCVLVHKRTDLLTF